jgi:hypothetical protein
MRKLAALCVASFCGVGAWACSAAGSEAFGIVAQGIVASLGASAVGAAQQADVLSSSQLAPPSLDDVRDRSAPWDEIDRYLKPPGRSAAAPASETEPAPFTPPGQHQPLAQQSEQTGRHTAAQAPAEEDAVFDPWVQGAAAMATTGILGVLGLLWQKRRRLQRRLQAAAQLASAWSQAKSVADSQHSVGQTVRRAA